MQRSSVNKNAELWLSGVNITIEFGLTLVMSTTQLSFDLAVPSLTSSPVSLNLEQEEYNWMLRLSSWAEILILNVAGEVKVDPADLK